MLPENNPQNIYENLYQIGIYMFRKEKIDKYLNLQKIDSIDYTERSKTINWMTVISFYFRLLEKTLALAIECFDLYLQNFYSKKGPFEKINYEFLGLASLFMASKYEEIYPPSARVRKYNIKDFIIRGARRLLSHPDCPANNFEMIKDKIDCLKQILFKLESDILSSLEFNTSRILTIDFINYISFDAGFLVNSKEYNYCLYLLNICYYSRKLISLPKSLLAMSIVYFVGKIFAKEKYIKKGDNHFSLKIKEKMKNFEKINREFKSQFILKLDDNRETPQYNTLNTLKRIDSAETINLPDNRNILKNVANEVCFKINQIQSVAHLIFSGKI